MNNNNPQTRTNSPQFGSTKKYLDYICRDQKATVACPFPSSFDFVRTNGSSFTPVGLPDHFIAYAGKVGRCYYNAFMMASDFRNELNYAEGYILRSGGHFPILHAWCVDNNGNAVDPTWGRDTSLWSGADYYGVEFPIDYVSGIFLRHKSTDSVIENWRDGSPLLMGNHIVNGQGVIFRSAPNTETIRFTVSPTKKAGLDV